MSCNRKGVYTWTAWKPAARLIIPASIFCTFQHMTDIVFPLSPNSTNPKMIIFFVHKIKEEKSHRYQKRRILSAHQPLITYLVILHAIKGYFWGNYPDSVHATFFLITRCQTSDKKIEILNKRSSVCEAMAPSSLPFNTQRYKTPVWKHDMYLSEFSLCFFLTQCGHGVQIGSR